MNLNLTIKYLTEKAKYIIKRNKNNIESMEFIGPKKNLLTHTAGCYGRMKEAILDRADCDVCMNHKIVMSFDSSDQEYSAISICKECFNKLMP